MDVSCEIISRGQIRITLGEKFVVAQGELTFNPPVFYLDSSSLKIWTEPAKEMVSEAELLQIRKALANAEIKGTKIVIE